MKKEIAKKILQTPDEILISLWKKTNFEDYLSLLETMTDDQIAYCIKKMAQDVLEDQATCFNVDGKKRYEYLGE